MISIIVSFIVGAVFGGAAVYILKNQEVIK